MTDPKKIAKEVGERAGISLFHRLMDYFAKKRPNGLVARFRKRRGRLTDAEIKQYVDDAVEEAKRRR